MTARRGSRSDSDELGGPASATAPSEPSEPSGGPADGRKQRWAAHREQRRAELVEAAVAAIDRVGASAGMDDIAAEAGVTKPVIYRYFADKADLHVAVGQQVASQLMVDVLGAIESSDNPKEMLTAAIDAYLVQIEASPNLYRFVVNRPLAGSAGPDVAHDYQELIAAGVARSVGRGLRQAGLDSGGAEPWAYGIVGYVRAAGDWWLERRSMARPDLTGYLVALLWGGLLVLHQQAGLDAQTGELGELRLLSPPDDQARAAGDRPLE
jgi:AcrR family transcriptional regulator